MVSLSPKQIKQELKLKGVDCLCYKTANMIRINTVEFNKDFDQNEQDIITSFLRSNEAKGVMSTPVSVNYSGSEFFF
ncbi:MAG: hypothetical protein V4547_08925 [Bacteroidota bacterium]